jgi:hypothetical protein
VAHFILTQPANSSHICIALTPAISNCGASKEVSSADSTLKLTEFTSNLHLEGLGDTVPSFSIANYSELLRPTITLLHLTAHTSLARDYAVAAEANEPLLHAWLGETAQPAQIVELADSNANPWQNGSVLFTPLREAPSSTLQLLLLPVQVAARFDSPHPWIKEGVQRFLQAVSVDNRSGRRAALEYLDQYREPLVQTEKASHSAGTAEGNAHESDNTLLNTHDEVYLRGKSAFVFWMLRDMNGDEAMQHSLAAYRAGADKDPTYFQRLVQTASKKDLEWFFDDWVYRDRGLPDFHVDSVYPRPLLGTTETDYLVTATIENRGHSAAEVPVLAQTSSGEKSARVLVKPGEKSVVRIAVPSVPTRIVVNDGSVPEANTGNNAYDVSPPQR